MVRQEFNVAGYWDVIVYYDIDYRLFSLIAQELRDAGISEEELDRLYTMMKSGQAKAVTFSNQLEHISIVAFNKHNSREDYISSIVHEAEHVKQAMLRAYQVEDADEPPAYTIGYLVAQMYRVFKEIICDTCG